MKNLIYLLLLCLTLLSSCKKHDNTAPHENIITQFEENDGSAYSERYDFPLIHTINSLGVEVYQCQVKKGHSPMFRPEISYLVQKSNNKVFRIDRGQLPSIYKISNVKQLHWFLDYRQNSVGLENFVRESKVLKLRLQKHRERFLENAEKGRKYQPLRLISFEELDSMLLTRRIEELVPIRDKKMLDKSFKYIRNRKKYTLDGTNTSRSEEIDSLYFEKAYTFLVERLYSKVDYLYLSDNNFILVYELNHGFEDYYLENVLDLALYRIGYTENLGVLQEKGVEYLTKNCSYFPSY